MSSEHCRVVGCCKVQLLLVTLDKSAQICCLGTQMVQGARFDDLYCCRHIQSWCLGLCRHTQEHQFTTVEGIRMPFPFATKAPIKS